MKYEFFIARRYLFSKKSTHAINIISSISVIGVTVATMALVVTLSVFNGFHDMVAGLFTNFDPQLKVVPVEGKAVAADDPILTKIRTMPEVDVATECVEDMALAVYGERQKMVTVKGVEDNFDQLTHIRDILIGDGQYELHAGPLDYGILGIRLASDLQTGSLFKNPLKIYAPVREGQLDMTDPESGFTLEELYSPGVIFMVKQVKYDRAHIITSIDFARRLFDRQGMVTQLELRLKPGSDFNAVKQKMQDVAGTKYRVQDRMEQQAETYNIMNIEKLIAYAFLSFILVIACFNIIGSLSMLIIDKQKDVITLRNLGARDSQIRRIFLFEGWMISLSGALLGIILGLLLCLAQQQWGIVKLGQEAGAFIVDAYPVSVHPQDIALVFLTVAAIGFISVLYPVYHSVKR